MTNMQIKLDNPERVKELNPEHTLSKIGLRDGHVFCDIGAGSGVFTIPAAKITKNSIYALDTSDDMLTLISEKAKQEKIKNIKPIKVEGNRFDLPDETANIVLMAAVLHEIAEKPAFVAEVKRLLKIGGKAAVIEFHKRDTPNGPGLEHRLGRDEAFNILLTSGLQPYDEFDVGDNYYCLVFRRAP